jgi:thiol-disulfide isomerase/thioredoxin
VAQRSPAKKTPIASRPASRNAARPAPARRTGGRPAGLFTWIAVGLVLVVVAVLVIVKVTSGSSSNPPSTFQKADPAVVADLTGVPASVFDTVGIRSSVVPVTAPTPLKNQPDFTGTNSQGKVVPKVFYFGAEYCPFCAAERWPLIIALSRFGTWSDLGNMISSTHTNEVYPGTPTFTFLKATYSSPYLAFSSTEEYTNQWSNSLGFYTPLQKPSAVDKANFYKYDTPAYIPGLTSSTAHSIPYLTFGNKWVIAGSSYSPSLLANQSRNAIAAGLKDASSPVTQAIVATANYLTAALCSVTKDQPSTVCSSTGVTAAKKSLKIK